MFASFTRGWVMAKASWAVLKDQPSLAVFPIASVIAGSIFRAGVDTHATTGIDLLQATFRSAGAR